MVGEGHFNASACFPLRVCLHFSSVRYITRCINCSSDFSDTDRLRIACSAAQLWSFKDVIGFHGCSLTCILQPFVIVAKEDRIKLADIEIKAMNEFCKRRKHAAFKRTVFPLGSFIPHLPLLVFSSSFPVDINECQDVSLCDVSATCIDNVGSFVCQCPAGFTGSGLRIGSGCTSECLY